MDNIYIKYNINDMLNENYQDFTKNQKEIIKIVYDYGIIDKKSIELLILLNHRIKKLNWSIDNVIEELIKYGVIERKESDYGNKGYKINSAAIDFFNDEYSAGVEEIYTNEKVKYIDKNIEHIIIVNKFHILTMFNNINNLAYEKCRYINIVDKNLSYISDICFRISTPLENKKISYFLTSFFVDPKDIEKSFLKQLYAVKKMVLDTKRGSRLYSPVCIVKTQNDASRISEIYTNNDHILKDSLFITYDCYNKNPLKTMFKSEYKDNILKTNVIDVTKIF